jgi:hypothetical protein
MSRACDLVDEKQYWHLLRTVAAEFSPSNARYSLLPNAPSEEDCAPFDEAKLLASATASTRTFRTAAGLPPFMSLAEASAIRLLGASVLHADADADAASAREPNSAVDFISSAYKQIYGRGIEHPRTVKALATELAAAANSVDGLVTAGAQFRSIFTASSFPPKATEFAADWQRAFRTTPSEAAAWSAYFFVVGACGATVEDPTFVKRVLRKVGGVVGGHGGGNSVAVDNLIDKINSSAKTYNDEDLDNATRCTLLQSSLAHTNVTASDNPLLV